jgi:nitrate/nitrite-specific signal transduction histidine kinase
VLISGFFETIKFKSYQDCESEIEHLERAFKKFCNETHKIVEYMYPIGLHDSDWTSSFKQLAEQLSTNEVVVDFESLGDKTPSSTLLQHTYWAVHEIVINAIKHSKAHRLQISLVSETTDFTVTILYKASSQSLKWLNNRLSTNLGYGTSIIKDRLKIIDATYEVHAINGFVSHIIRLPYENPTA